MIKYAGFEDLLAWRKTYLDKVTHSSLVTVDLLGEDGDFRIVYPFTQIACKLFDHLCCGFHALTGFDFIFNGKDLFQKGFRVLYQDFKTTN